MLKLRFILAMFIGGLILPVSSYALVSSNGMGGGAWSAAPSWDTGIPVCGDSILIQVGDVITIGAQQDYSACGSPMVLTINGTLRFPGNGPKLRMPTGSTIIVNVGGLISAPGGGNGNKISIGGSWVWEKKDGDVPGYACFGGCTPLPVEFLSVEALPKEKSVCVKWMTVTESNNDYFTIERSTDGVQFKEVMTVQGAGTSNSPIQYVAKDREPLEGLSYYRIKQTDYDEDFAYSEIVVVEVSFVHSSSILIYPNPISKSSNIYIAVDGITEGEVISVSVRNAKGELDHLQDFTASNNGSTILSVSTGGQLQPGLSFISVLVDGELSTSKIMIR